MKEIFFGNKNTGTKRIFILFVSFVALFLFFPVYAKASPIYTPVNAQVPFQCRKPDADKDISYTIIMDTISSNAPLPKDSKLSLAGGQNGNFEIRVTEPGTYVKPDDLSVLDRNIEMIDIIFKQVLYIMINKTGNSRVRLHH